MSIKYKINSNINVSLLNNFYKKYILIQKILVNKISQLNLFNQIFFIPFEYPFTIINCVNYLYN